jgi:hypothetical protein
VDVSDSIIEGGMHGLRSNRRIAALLLALTILAACGGTSRPAARATATATTPTPATSPSVRVDPSTLSAQVWSGPPAGAPVPVGYDDHIGFVIVNTGRDIGNLFIDLSGGDRWLDHHGIAMGTTRRCNAEAASEGVDCGPLPSGRELDVALRALPSTPGTLHYTARFFDRTGTAMQEIRRPDGGPLVISFDETVVPQAGQP